MNHREEKLNVNFNLDFDGNELAIFLCGTDVTAEVKELLGKENFRDLENSFKPKFRDRYDQWVDNRILEGQP